MRHCDRVVRPAAACLLACLAGVGGCGKKIWITQYPSFYTPDLQTILVVPFKNATTHPAAGRIVSEKVATALAANATYRIVRRGDLKVLAGLEAPGEPGALAATLRKGGKVQAILTGTVTTYHCSQHWETRKRTIDEDEDERRKKKHKRRVPHYERYTFVRNQATVDATARLIRVSDGTAIHATRPGAAMAQVTSETQNEGQAPPPLDREGALAAAANQCTAKLLEEFAVVRKQISVGRNAFRTAAELRDGKWRGGKDFQATDEKMLVVVSFPACCDRNTFRIVISRKDDGGELVAAQFTWLRHWSSSLGKAFEFSPKEIAAKGGGKGDYVAKLLSGPEVVLETKFKIEEPD